MITYLIYKISTASALKHLENYTNFNVNLVLLVFTLSFINWGIEAKKWQILVKNITNLSFINSFKSVLAGLSIGIFTPNRLGNFIGRLAWIDKSKHNQATINTMLGNLAQFVSTVIFGILGFTVVIIYEFNIQYAWLILLFSVVIIIIGLSLYYNPIKVKKTFFIRFLSNETLNSLNTIANTSLSFKHTVLGLSLLRYLVFLSQYFLLFRAFYVELDDVLLLGLISTVYLLTTLIPSIFFGKLFVRESVAVFVFSFVNLESPLVLLIAFLLWLINLAIPAILGGMIWLNQSKNK